MKNSSFSCGFLSSNVTNRLRLLYILTKDNDMFHRLPVRKRTVFLLIWQQLENDDLWLTNPIFISTFLFCDTNVWQVYPLAEEIFCEGVYRRVHVEIVILLTYATVQSAICTLSIEQREPYRPHENTLEILYKYKVRWEERLGENHHFSLVKDWNNLSMFVQNRISKSYLMKWIQYFKCYHFSVLWWIIDLTDDVIVLLGILMWKEETNANKNGRSTNLHLSTIPWYDLHQTLKTSQTFSFVFRTKR